MNVRDNTARRVTMILGTPDTIHGEYETAYHGGEGAFFRRTLLEEVPSSVFRYVRDITLPPGSIIGEHPHSGEDEVYFIISGTGVMVVDGEEQVVGPGTAILTLSGSVHGIRNEGTENLRMFVACARTVPS
jgi:mannose-6-phosphate isomerase-like protein (cupin superfamily)